MRLRSAPDRDRLEVAALETGEATWEGRLARALVVAESEQSQVDAASEAVADLAIRYGSRSQWSSAALRIQVLGAALMASWAVADNEKLGAAVALIVGGCGAFFVHVVGRRAADREKEQRTDADAFVRWLLPSVQEAPITRSKPRSVRRTGRASR